jgi:methylisocitrate lyase
MLAKIRAAVAVRRDPDLLIIARTDAYADHGLDEALWRCRLFLKAGADIAKPQGVDRPDEIRRAMAEVPCPFVATLSQASRNRELDIADLRKLGVATISLPSVSLFAAARAVSDAMATLYETQSIATVEPGLITLDDYNKVTGLDQKLADEATFRDEAHRIVETGQTFV